VIFVFTWFSRVLTSCVLTSRASTSPLLTSALGTYLRPDHVRTAARLENWCPRCYNHMLAVFSFAFASRHARLALFSVAFRPDHVRTAARLTRGSLIFFYHRSFHIKHPSYYFSIVVQPRAAIVVSFLCHTCTFCMWGIPYLWIARSLPIPPFPARFTVFRILSCFSHSYLLYLAYVWY
jgi:hypothetical protein